MDCYEFGKKNGFLFSENELATLPRVEAHSITAKSPHFFPKVNIKVLKTKDPKIMQKKEEKLFVLFLSTNLKSFYETSNEFPP